MKKSNFTGRSIALLLTLLMLVSAAGLRTDVCAEDITANAAAKDVTATATVAAKNLTSTATAATNDAADITAHAVDDATDSSDLIVPEKDPENHTDEAETYNIASEGETSSMSAHLDNCFLRDEKSGGNTVYSPLSIRYALAMLADGAEGETKQEIENLLGGWNVPTYRNAEECLSIANAVFCKDDLQLNAGYEEKLAQYLAEIIRTDFSDIVVLDRWVSSKTFDMIKNSGIQSSPALRMVLLNALALKLSWEDPYEYYGYDEFMPFYDADGNELEVPAMCEKFYGDCDRYYLGDDLTVIVKGLEACGDVSLQCAFIQPKNIEEFADSFNAQQYQEILAKTETASSNSAGTILQLPKFAVDYQLDLTEGLKALGVEKAFSGEADFSGMTETEKLFVDQAIHKAYIKVNEQGIEAAAMTAMLMCGALYNPEQPVTVTIDHPFLFVISDQTTGEIWFEGCVMNPLD